MKNATAVKERPILMSAPMVCALIEGRKTQTRRVVALREFGPSDTLGYQWHFRDRRGLWNDISTERLLELCPYGVPGDRLWVRETWHHEDASCFDPKCGQPTHIFYRVTEPYPESIRWRPSIFMPRWASRITLEITEVRVQRVQETSEEDARAEGVDITTGRIDAIANCETEPKNLREVYGRLWDFLNAKSGYSWASDPWVWVIGFKRVAV